MTARTFYLPRSPSLNNLFVNKVGGGRALSKRYGRWRHEAEQLIMLQREPGLPPIGGRYVLELTCERQKNTDLDGKIKAPSDVLVAMNVIADDSLCEEIRVRWGAVKGCVVTVTEISAAPEKSLDENRGR